MEYEVSQAGERLLLQLLKTSGNRYHGDLLACLIHPHTSALFYLAVFC